MSAAEQQGKKAPRRRPRRELLRLIERRFELEHLDYLRRIRSERSRTKLSGVMAAGAFYTVFFVAGFTAWKFGAVPPELFGKLSWVMMIPATVFGVTYWLIAGNRREYPLRQQARDHIAGIEGATGLLWRLEPLVQALLAQDMVAQRALEQSRRGSAAIDPEDYIVTIEALHQALAAQDAVASQILQAVEEALAQQ
ncbi:MAG: hypothetical protein HY940_00035 [Gammaproteobacteria bacterium]|nr:hypothetical protein [Gammaproteobacteria bacterium]